ncbi:PAS domain S-box-containing protein [Pontibacter ummariensis]|uniref:histidine kinase n=1 Tax=Pontibacter ummariensis TaxID=1610492 RepID=A0A239FFV1_9BACT|nr:ATP-binding protein [Pontibacter ummariensis]PRY12268.1 PAS domain S-box-containing protein [Pontibacter ummariensis]SNS55900.1 PAS domain S-box-containing protein [Pontibacter ummariensis]
MGQANSDTIYQKDTPGFLKGGGEMGALMRAYNWAAHPLGEPAQWPESLKTSVRLLLNSGFPMFIWWSKDFYMFHNDAYLPALGKKHPEALGTSARVMWSEIWEQIGQVAEGIMTHEEQFYAENMFILLDRKGFLEETYWTFSYSPVFNDAGEVAGVFCACTEVTDTILGQRRLKTLKEVSEASTQTLTLEQVCQSVCDILHDNKNDVPFSMVYLLNGTGTAARLLGKGGGLSENVFPEQVILEKAGPDCPFLQVQKTKKQVIIDLPVAGEKASAEPGLGLQPIHRAAVLPIFRTGQNRLIGFFIAGLSPRLEYDQNYQNLHHLLAGQMATTITSVRTREEMARQREYLNDIFQQAPVGITILRGPQFIVDLANPGICEIWGRKPADVLGKPVLEAIPEALDQGIKELLEGVLNTGVPFVANEHHLMLERNGKMEDVYVNFVYHPMRDAQGFITGVIAVAIEINEQVEARHEIEAINKELLATNADLDNFVYSASHDLKAPISNIEGLLEVLVDYLPAETMEMDVVQQLIHHIRASIERFKKAVADLSEVAKIQRESGEDITAVNLVDVVAEVELDFEKVIRETGARIHRQFSPHSTIHFSSKNARSVVYNLLSNALKYRAPNRLPEIHITTEKRPGYLVLAVADNGLGIDLSEERKMFSMFKRLHDHVEGSGVGLYIVKRIVENAGGRIEVESQVGKGSTFRIFFKQKHTQSQQAATA